MNRIATILAILCLAATAQAAPLIDADGNYHATRPTRYETATGVVAVGSDEWLINNAGWRLATEQEIADREAARAAEQAAAEAQASLPAVFPNGIAVLDADDHHMELVPIADGQPPLSIQISDSPLDKATRDAKVAAKLAEFAAAKAERKALKDRELDDLKAAIASAKNHKELGAAVVKWIEATEPATVEDSK